MDKIELASYAKVNLTLEVSALRSDGYHDLDSVVQSIDFADELTITQAPPGVIEARTHAVGVPSGPENLVYRACKAFFEVTSLRGGARCSIKKTIPPQAGMGGGSSNAAAAIVGLDRLYETRMDVAPLLSIAARVGSDVPLFICSGTVRMRGRGDMVQALPDAPPFHVVVIKPKRGVSTAWAYSELDKREALASSGASDAAEEAVRQGDRGGLVAAMMNDFDPVVTAAFPEIAAAKHFLLDAGAKAALLCGSGSAVFGVFDTQAEAEAAADRARAQATPFSIFVSSFLPRPA
jgi:4-diphosphocytidyl-2-C-methyl-D-erythritol kinase